MRFGRSAGSVKAELDEFDGYNINNLGNWNVDTRRDVYSAKLPMRAMCVMTAGHPDEKRSFFVARSHQTFNDPAINKISVYRKKLNSFTHTATNSSASFCKMKIQ